MFHRKLLLFCRETRAGVSISYPDISVHALQRLKDPATAEKIQGIYLQVTASDSYDDHNPDETLSFSIIPTQSRLAISSELPRGEEPSGSRAEPNSHASALFHAISACSSLHPDPVSLSDNENAGDQGDGAGAFQSFSSDGLPPAMPGSGGWITAENAADFFDENGQWRGPALGPGAGTVRAREDDTNGHGAVDGEDEEAKWRRTE